MTAKVSPEAGVIDEEDFQILNDEEDDQADPLFARQRQKYAEIHKMQGCTGLDFRKTPTIQYMREAAGEGRLMWYACNCR